MPAEQRQYISVMSVPAAVATAPAVMQQELGILRPMLCRLCCLTDVSLSILSSNCAHCSEIIDAMWAPSKYDLVYPLSYLFTFTIAAPHSMLVQLAYPKENLAQGARPTTPQLLMIRGL